MTALLFIVVHRLLQPERTAIFIQKALGYPEPSFGWDHPLCEFDQIFLAQQSPVKRSTALLQGDANVIHDSGATAQPLLQLFTH